jgi:hypothetical protein
MSIFSSIRDAIFGGPTEAAEANAHAAPPASPAAGTRSLADVDRVLEAPRV